MGKTKFFPKSILITERNGFYFDYVPLSNNKYLRGDSVIGSQVTGREFLKFTYVNCRGLGQKTCKISIFDNKLLSP